MICKIMLVHDRNWDVFFFFFPKALMLLIRNLLVHTFILFIISYSYPWNYFSVRALGRLLEIPIVYPALVFDFVWVPVLHYKCYMLCRWCLSMTHRPFSIWGSLSIKYKCAHIPDMIIPNFKTLLVFTIDSCFSPRLLNMSVQHLCSVWASLSSHVVTACYSACCGVVGQRHQ